MKKQKVLVNGENRRYGKEGGILGKLRGMRNTNDTDGGFSLVELIVVVLIMAIIAVALAPQVMKWVENSRIATDCSNYDSIVSAASIAMAEEAAHGEVCNQTTDTTISAQDYSTDWVIAPVGGTGSELYKAISVTLGSNWANEIRPKSAFANNYVITIKTDGTIVRTNPPAADLVS